MPTVAGSRQTGALSTNAFNTISPIQDFIVRIYSRDQTNSTNIFNYN